MAAAALHRSGRTGMRVEEATVRWTASVGRAASSAISPRELDVLLELERGGSNKHIARVLGITEHTVKFHLKNLYRKLGVNRRTQALRVARDRGVI